MQSSAPVARTDLRNRNEFADALKALAILGVFLVNGMGYFAAPAHPFPLGQALPADSWLSAGVHALVFTVCMGKAWPLLTYLFGHSLGLMAMRLRAQPGGALPALNARYRKLLLIGVLHGSLLYFGDVLTSYALCAFWVSRWVHLKTRVLLRKLVFWCAVAGVAWLVTLAFAWAITGDPSGGDWLKAQSYALTHRRADWVWLNVSTYLEMLLGLLLHMPQVLALMLGGVICARLRLMEVRRGLSLRVWRAPGWTALFVLGAIAQLSLTLVMLWQSQREVGPAWWLLQVLNTAAGICWVVAAVALLARRAHLVNPGWMTALAPAGRYTLVLYLSLSASLALLAPAWAGGWLLSRGVHPLGHSAAALVCLCAVWVMGVWASRLASARGWRDPLARWLGQTTTQRAQAERKTTF